MVDGQSDRFVVPFLGVTHHTFPGTTGGRRERELVVMGRERLETENFDASASSFIKLQTRLYHARIIIYKECGGIDVFPHIVKMIFADCAIAIDEQFAVVSLGQRILGDALVRQRVVKVRYE